MEAPFRHCLPISGRRAVQGAPPPPNFRPVSAHANHRGGATIVGRSSSPPTLAAPASRAGDMRVARARHASAAGSDSPALSELEVSVWLACVAQLGARCAKLVGGAACATCFASRRVLSLKNFTFQSSRVFWLASFVRARALAQDNLREKFPLVCRRCRCSLARPLAFSILAATLNSTRRAQQEAKEMQAKKKRRRLSAQASGSGDI